MSRRAKHDVLHAFALSVVAFVLHLAWENIQCRIFFEHGSYDASQRGMALATLGDVGITWALYAAVAVVSWQWRWSAQRWSWWQWVMLLCLALAIGWAIETRALARHRWSYKALTPLLPGMNVSAIPILQLLVLTPLAFRLADLDSSRKRPSSRFPRPPSRPPSSKRTRRSRGGSSRDSRCA